MLWLDRLFSIRNDLYSRPSVRQLMRFGMDVLPHRLLPSWLDRDFDRRLYLYQLPTGLERFR